MSSGRGRGRRRIGDPSPPPPSLPRSADAVWPEHFVESVIVQVAVDAATSGGRRHAAQAIAVIFQVCSTWRSISQSEFLWQQLTNRIWSRSWTILPSWREEYANLHQTARNLHINRAARSQLLPASQPAAACCRLAISESYVAAGFLDGTVRLFSLPDGNSVAMYHSNPHRERLGQFSQAISGLVILRNPDRLIFASQDGDINVAHLDDVPISGVFRLAHGGNVVEDGTLVDFTADDQHWVGLFAGVPGRSCHIWNSESEQLMYIGGALTDPDAVLGWHSLTDLDVQVVGFVRIATQGSAVACTSSMLQVLDLNDYGTILNELVHRRSAVVKSFDACEGRSMVVDTRGLCKVRSVPELEELQRFMTLRRGDGQQQQRAVATVGCMNWGYVFLSTGESIRVWDAINGEHLYRFRERLGVVSVIAASHRYVAAWADDSGLHLWDFGVLL